MTDAGNSGDGAAGDTGADATSDVAVVDADTGAGTDAVEGTDATPGTDVAGTEAQTDDTWVADVSDAATAADADATATDDAVAAADVDASGDAVTDPSDADDALMGDADDVADAIGTDAGDDVAAAPAAPALASLAVNGLTFVAPFSPDVHDYAVYCAAGSNQWTVLAAPATDSTAAIVAPDPAAFDTSNAVTLTVVENEAVVVRATGSGGATADYWLRCLPHDFPHLSFVTSTTPPPGYYILGNTAVSPGAGGYAMVLDSNGTPVWYASTVKGACLVESVGQNMLAWSPILGAAYGTDPNGKYTVLDLSTGATTAVQAVGSPTDQHELRPLGAGRYMVLTYPQLEGVDLSSRGVAATTIMDCKIQELNADGSVAWQWLASDHIDPVVESSELAPAVVGGTNVVDVFHCNSLDLDANGDVLLSVRHTDALFLISRATGQLIWKLGGTAQNKDSAPHLTLFGDTEGGFFHQHFARVLPNGDVSVFDNHSNQPGAARGLEMALDVTGGTASVVMQLDGPSNSAAMGDFETFPDGTHVIGWGMLTGPSPDPSMTEFDALGNVVRQLFFAAADVPYRVNKVPLSQLDIGLLRANVALPPL